LASDGGGVISAGVPGDPSASRQAAVTGGAAVGLHCTVEPATPAIIHSLPWPTGGGRAAPRVGSSPTYRLPAGSKAMPLMPVYDAC
jgi:hypothetical protein